MTILGQKTGHCIVYHLRPGKQSKVILQFLHVCVRYPWLKQYVCVYNGEPVPVDRSGSVRPSLWCTDVATRTCIIMLMPMTHAPETGTENPYQKSCNIKFSAGVSCESVSIFSGTKIWYRVEQCSTRYRKPWPKWRVLIGQTIASCVVCLYISCVVCCFIALKWNMGGQLYRKINPEILFPVSSGTKNWYQKTDTSFLVPVLGTDFWCVCLRH